MSEEKKEKRFEFSDVYKQLAAEFPAEALSVDSSRGFALTSVKAQYIIERLNETVGIDGWNHSGTYELVDGGVIFKGRLILDDGTRGTAREATGYSAIKKNIGDAYKSARTDSLSKCASHFGVANSVYKGIIAPPTSAMAKAAPKKKATTAREDF